MLLIVYFRLNAHLAVHRLPHPRNDSTPRACPALHLLQKNRLIKSSLRVDGDLPRMFIVKPKRLG